MSLIGRQKGRLERPEPTGVVGHANPHIRLDIKTIMFLW